MDLQFEGGDLFVHPTAVVEPRAVVGAFTKVWLFSHVDNGAVVGENCSLGQNTYVAPDAIVGNACRLGNSVSIFGHVELQDFVFCAPYMVFTHIAFPRAAVNRHAVFKKTLVKTGTTFGANSTVVPDITVGMGTFLAAGSTLTKSTKDWSFMVGSPARHIGWVSRIWREDTPPPFRRRRMALRSYRRCLLPVRRQPH